MCRFLDDPKGAKQAALYCVALVRRRPTMPSPVRLAENGLLNAALGNITWKGYHIVRVCLLSLLIAGCASVRPNFETPGIQVTSFSMLPSSGLEARFKIGLRVTNPNRQALKVRGMSYNVSLEGFKFIKGVGNNIPTIPGYGEKEFFVEASTNLIESIKMLTSFVNNPRDKLKYAFGAKLDTGSVILPRLNLRDRGEINLNQLSEPVK